jgi:hypothetical protein
MCVFHLREISKGLEKKNCSLINLNNTNKQKGEEKKTKILELPPLLPRHRRCRRHHLVATEVQEGEMGKALSQHLK